MQFHGIKASRREFGWERTHGRPFRVHLTKTRIGFIARMTFAAVTLQKGDPHAHVVLDRRLDHPRFTRIEIERVHHFRVRRREDRDDEVQAWLCEADAAGT